MNIFSRLRPLALCLVPLCLAGPLRAEPASLELILDCSASMWNKLEDGRYRIDGAKQVLTEFLTATPGHPELHIGLRLYGAKVPFSQPGACEDSVLVTPVEGFARAAMLKAVKDARAVGATPLAKSLQLAKDDFTKPGPRRLIVCTDGEESCGGDVEAALTALKAAGIDVDVRMIGIGLSDQAAARFSAMGVPVENVHSAKKLAEALGKAAELPKPAAPASEGFTIRLVKDGKPFTGVAPAMVSAVSGAAVKLSPLEEGAYQGRTVPGAYDVTAGKKRYSNQTVLAGEKNEWVLDLTEAAPVALTVVPAEGGVIGGEIGVRFQGARGVDGEFVTIAAAAAPDFAEPAWAATDLQKEGSVKIRVLGDPGPHEARFITVIDGEKVLAGRSKPFTLALPSITLKVPEEVTAAEEFLIQWTGPAMVDDWIGWVPAGAKEGAYENYGRPGADGKPIRLIAPAAPGTYEVRYGTEGTTKVLARAALKVVEGTVALEAPASVMAGSKLPVVWKGPKSAGTFVTLVMPDAEPTAYTHYFHTDLTPERTALQTPRKPGVYELRISTGSGRDGAVLLRRPVTLTEIKASLDAPSQAKAGALLPVKWTGPAGDGDFITMTKPDAAESAYLEYFYTDMSPEKGELPLPAEPGAYELRYVADQQVVARKAILVE